MHKINILIIFILCCYSCVLQGQKEGNIWHFGKSAALDFNSGTAIVTTPSSMWTFEGSASISDANGQLLFYTNGGGRDPILSGQPSGKIWNRNHALMYDMGNIEGGGFSSAQSAVIVPKPGQANHYYLFTMEEGEFDVGGSVPSQPQGRGLSYFDVDMSLDGGLGGVVSYVGQILVPSYEGLCAIRHSNGSDYWIIVHNAESGLAVLPVNAAGVGLPQVFNVPGGTNGIIKGAPNGKWVTTSDLLFTFDNLTGTLGSPLTLPNDTGASEFSPNSKRLFVISSNDEAAYFDLTSSNIDASKVSFGTAASAAQMQLAPDGKIYFVQTSFFTDTVYLSAITCPNSSPFLEINKFAFSGDDDNIFFGLPNFDNAIFRRDEDPPLVINLGDDQVLCTSQQSIVIDAGINNATYTWSTGAQTQTISITTPGTYAVTVTTAGCGTGIDTLLIRESQLSLNAGPDQSICKGDTLVLAAAGSGSVTWVPADLVSNSAILNPVFTGNSNANLVITSESGGCTLQDTLVITVADRPVVAIVPTDTTLAAGTSVALQASGTGTFLWSPAAGLSCVNCPNPIASPTETTTYTLTVTNQAGCSVTESVTITVTLPDCTTRIPNAFSPNNDMANEDFKPLGLQIESYTLSIYNRWGQQVFKGNTPWDGRVNNTDAPCDVYIYKVNMQVCGAAQIASGEVTLIR